MFKRLVAGVGEGCAVAAIVVVALRALAADWSSVGVVYAASVVVGLLTGLVAGRPVWRPGSKVEASVKAVVGAFIAATTMLGIRKWLPHVNVDLGAHGRGPLGAVPAAALPIVASALALVFEIDHAFGPDPSPHRQRVPAGEPPPSGDSVNHSSARAKRNERS